MTAMMDLTMIDAGAAALRRCALTLHAVGARDRQWMLAQLPETSRAELERLIGELQALGIPVEPGVTHRALKRDRPARAATATTAASVALSESATARARSAEAADLARVLQHEPPALIAHVMGLLGESAHGLLEHLSAPRRRQVQELLSPVARASTAASAPLLSQALLEQVSIRLSQAAPASPALSRFAAARWRSRWPGLARMLS